MRSMLIAVGICLFSSCEDSLKDNTTLLPEEQGVDVTLSIGVEPSRDAYDLLPEATRSASRSNTGFCAELIPTEVKTRANAQLTPDKLYNLEIGLYDAAGNQTYYKSFSSVNIGEYLTLSGVPTGGYQLVLIVRGSTGLFASINKVSLAKVRTNITTSMDNIKALSATAQTDMNKMPYALYLKNVQVTNDGKLVSSDSPADIRLLLKRLAARVTLKWKYTVSGYDLTEVSLRQVPQWYRAIPDFQGNVGGVDTYPSLVDEYVDAYRLSSPGNDNIDAGGYTVWVPANVRGIIPEVVTPSYRSKYNAPTSAMFAEFRLENTTEKKRLFCRAYIGGNQTNDFNVRENTDYTWNISLTKANVEDDRVNEQDLHEIFSDNLVTTSNCFMMEPGTDICFNPYKHEADDGGVNTYLIEKVIAKVKLLWQSKDAGTSGDLVLGYVAADDNHTNLVNYKDLGDREKGRIHVKVPKTKGGNALIAAYDVGNNIVWSWHLWVSEYVPVAMDASTVTDNDTRAIAIANARLATQGGTVQTYAGGSWTESVGAFYKKVIMDRNLGAAKAGIQTNKLDAVRTFGLLYQGGRKDPFFSTADGTNTDTKTVYDGNGNALSLQKQGLSSSAELIRNPFVYGTRGFTPNDWDVNGKKTIHDPCPKGWKIPVNDINSNLDKLGIVITDAKKACMWSGFGAKDINMIYGRVQPTFGNVMYYDAETETLGSLKENKIWESSTVGSGYVYFGAEEGPKDDREIFFPAVSLREDLGEYRANVKNNAVFLWASTRVGDGFHQYQIQKVRDSSAQRIDIACVHTPGWNFAFSVRCIQE